MRGLRPDSSPGPPTWATGTRGLHQDLHAGSDPGNHDADQWRTPAIINGRLLRGRAFIPGFAACPHSPSKEPTPTDSVGRRCWPSSALGDGAKFLGGLAVTVLGLRQLADRRLPLSRGQ